MREGKNARRTHERRTENKNSLKYFIKINQVPVNYKELNEAIFSFFYNETKEM